MRTASSGRYLALALGLVLGVVLTFLIVTPPSPAPVDSEGFSGERALASVATYTSRPHSVLDDDARLLSLEELRREIDSTGFASEISTHVVQPNGVPTLHGVPSEVVGRDLHNIIVRIPGDSERTVLLMTHWDSAPDWVDGEFLPGISYGAADAGYGVGTVVEILRLLAAEPTPLANSLIILVTDAEELGMLGASWELATNPELFADVDLVVNVEASGTHGHAVMFETGFDAGGYVDTYLATAKRPLTFSAATALYQQLPFDTDLTVFLRAGFDGLNVAALEGAENYHTAEDNLDNINASTMQSYGDQVWPYVHHLLTEADLTMLSGHADLVYTTVAPGVALRYGAAIRWVLAAGAAAGLAALAWRWRSRGDESRPTRPNLMLAALLLPVALTVVTAATLPAFSYLVALPTVALLIAVGVRSLPVIREFAVGIATLTTVVVWGPLLYEALQVF